MKQMSIATAIAVCGSFSPFSLATAQVPRAPRPVFDQSQWSGVFFPSLNQAIGDERPSLAAIRASAAESSTGIEAEDAEQDADSRDFTTLVSAPNLESEVKRIKLRFDGHLSSPGAFKSGGFSDVRNDLTVLATLFAVISHYDNDVRWKSDAAGARDLLARSATNARTGTTEAYREAKLRQTDLQSLLAGSGVTAVGVATDGGGGEIDWSQIAARTPLMSYFEELIERLEENGFDAESIQENEDSVHRDAELLGLLGEVIVQPGMEGADDDDYAKLSRDMTARARTIQRAIRGKDYPAAEAAVANIRESCDNCHADYRFN